MTRMFSEPDRYEYNWLTPADVVMDVGGYCGNWSKIIVEKYGCRSVCFEPIGEFHRNIAARFNAPPWSNLIRVENVGLSDTTHRETFGIKGDSSGVAASQERAEEVQLVAIDEAMNEHDWLKGRDIAVLKLNCEGGEYAILERLLETDLISRFRALQVQPHAVVPGYDERWKAIKAALAKTHELMWDAEWCWSGWEKRT